MRNQLLTALALCLLSAPLAAQDFHSCFSHQGVNALSALGHDADGNLYTAAGGTGPYGNNQTFYLGPTNAQPETLAAWGPRTRRDG